MISVRRIYAWPWWSVFGRLSNVKSCNVHPCHSVRLCPVLQCPLLQFQRPPRASTWKNVKFVSFQLRTSGNRPRRSQREWFWRRPTTENSNMTSKIEGTYISVCVIKTPTANTYEFFCFSIHLIMQWLICWWSDTLLSVCFIYLPAADTVSTLCCHRNIRRRRRRQYNRSRHRHSTWMELHNTETG